MITIHNLLHVRYRIIDGLLYFHKGPGIWLTDLRGLFGEGVPEFIPKGYQLVDVVVFFMTVGMVFIHTPAR